MNKVTVAAVTVQDSKTLQKWCDSMSVSLVAAEELKTNCAEIEVPEDHGEDDDDDRRLWIGNLGTEITELVYLCACVFCFYNIHVYIIHLFMYSLYKVK